MPGVDLAETTLNTIVYACMLCICVSRLSEECVELARSVFTLLLHGTVNGLSYEIKFYFVTATILECTYANNILKSIATLWSHDPLGAVFR